MIMKASMTTFKGIFHPKTNICQPLQLLLFLFQPLTLLDHFPQREWEHLANNAFFNACDMGPK